MKKKILTAVITIALALTCVFALASCGGGASNVDGFITAISATKPATIEGSVKMYTEYGPLTATYTATIAEDSSFTLNYAYDKLNDTQTGGSADVVSKIEGTVTYSNGTYSDTSIAAKIPADAVAAKLNLGSNKISCKISDDGNVLSATVKAADTKAVLGVEYASDVTIVLTKANDKIVSLTLGYTLTEGKVEVICNYK